MTIMETFTEQLRAWEIFYSTVALASVTLVGLLFVSLTFHRESLKGRMDPRVLRLARGSFGDFLYVLMLGLVFLVPHPAPVGLAVALLVLGASRAAGLLRALIRPAQTKSRNPLPPSHGLREIAFPALASLILIGVAVEVWRGDMVALYGLVIVIAALLSSASWNAWLILAEEKVLKT
jgi:hypothetical protein